MIKIYYYPDGTWCREDAVSNLVELRGDDYHVTHVRESDTEETIQELIQTIVK